MASDLMSGILQANKTVGEINPMGNFLEGQKAAVDIQKQQMENAKVKYQQDLQVKLQKAIHDSVDPASGNIDPDKFKVVAHQYGVDPQAIDYALDNVVKIWDSAKKVSQAKQAVGAVSETGAEKVQEANKPSGASWTTSQRGSAAVPAPTSTQGEDKTGFTTPDMNVDKINIQNVGVEGQGQTATGQTFTLAPEPVPEAPKPPMTEGVVSAISGIQPSTGGSVQPVSIPTNPIKISNLDAKTQQSIISSMKQEGRVGRETKMGDYAKVSQDALDAVYQSYLNTVGNVPTKQMFTNADGSVDLGAFNRATSEYNAKIASADKAFRDDMSKKYGEQLSQRITVQGAERAQTTYEQQQAEIADAHSRGYKKVNQSNIAEFRDADAKYTQLGNARVEIEDLRKESPKLSSDEFNSKVEAMLVGPKASEGIASEAGTERFMESIRKDPSLGAIFKDARDPRELAMNLITKKLSAQDRNTLLKIIDGTIESQMKTGVAKSKLDAFKSWSKRGARATEDKTPSDGYVLVNSPAEAKKLAPGTKFKTPDGRKFTR